MAITADTSAEALTTSSFVTEDWGFLTTLPTMPVALYGAVIRDIGESRTFGSVDSDMSLVRVMGEDAAVLVKSDNATITNWVQLVSLDETTQQGIGVHFWDALQGNLLNNGEIEGFAYGVLVEGAAGSGAIIHNNHTIHGEYIGIGINESSVDFSNSGFLTSGSGAAIRVVNNSNDGFGVSISNERLIYSGDGPAIDASNAAGISVENVGQISGDIYGGKTSDFVYNSGNIQGDLVFGTGDDVFDGMTGFLVGSVWGNGGDDTISIGDGGGVVMGGNGDDDILGGMGPDSLDGGNDNDRLEGGAGADTLLGRSGDDRIFGGAGEDYLVGASGVDTLIGGGGDDILFGRSDGDLLRGGAGGDMLSGEDGQDTLMGEDGADRIQGGKGSDTLYGGEGADSFVFNLGDGSDVIMDYDDTDVVRISLDLVGRIDTEEEVLRQLAHQQGDNTLLIFPDGDVVKFVDMIVAALEIEFF